MKKIKEILIGTSFIWLPIIGIAIAEKIIEIIGG